MIKYQITQKHSKNSPIYVNEGDFIKVYDTIYKLTGSHLTGMEAYGWCELASIGEVFDDSDFIIEIIEE